MEGVSIEMMAWKMAGNTFHNSNQSFVKQATLRPVAITILHLSSLKQSVLGGFFYAIVPGNDTSSPQPPSPKEKGGPLAKFYGVSLLGRGQIQITPPERMRAGNIEYRISPPAVGQGISKLSTPKGFNINSPG